MFIEDTLDYVQIYGWSAGPLVSGWSWVRNTIFLAERLLNKPLFASCRRLAAGDLVIRGGGRNQFVLDIPKTAL